MKNKKGFTLIELLAVIVILAIIALIAVPIVLNMIGKVRKQAVVDSAYGYIESIEYNNGLADMNDDYNLGYVRVTGENQDVSGINVKMKGKKPDSGTISVGSNGKVTSAELCFGNYKVSYNGKEANVVSNSSECSSNNSENNNPASNEPEEESCTGATVDNPSEYDYLIGDDVTLTDGSKWVALRNSKKTDSTIRLISADAIKKDVSTSMTGQNMFTRTRSEYAIKYYSGKIDYYSSTDYTVYNGSNAQTFVKGSVKTALENSLNTTLSYVDIWTMEDLQALGVSFEYNSNNTKVTNMIYDKQKCWFDKVFGGIHLWTSIKYNDNNFSVFVNQTGSEYVTNVDVDIPGIKPVIVVSKSSISNS